MKTTSEQDRDLDYLESWTTWKDRSYPSWHRQITFATAARACLDVLAQRRMQGKQGSSIDPAAHIGPLREMCPRWATFGVSVVAYDSHSEFSPVGIGTSPRSLGRISNPAFNRSAQGSEHSIMPGSPTGESMADPLIYSPSISHPKPPKTGNRLNVDR
ncbi:hypothetical protein [Streptomyces sp. NPDC088748]|uniref:hypothetical protein n=1 Tax=Streptomyces sp. NPDC088748 TaxID=3365887 RepID=UPI0038126A58